MITRERFDEICKKNKNFTFWTNEGRKVEKVGKVSDIKEINEEAVIAVIPVDGEIIQFEDYLIAFNDPYYLSELFESKIDAEFDLYYSQIVRAQVIELPRYEKLEDKFSISIANGKIFPNGYSREMDINPSIMTLAVNADRVRVYTDYDSSLENEILGEILLDKPRNKSNYLEACKLFRKRYLSDDYFDILEDLY